MSKRVARAMVFSLLFLGAIGQVAAAPLDALQGAWTMTSTDDCANTFKKVGDAIEFKDRGSSLTTGIIIRGSKILGPLATCTVERIREEKDYFSAHMTCADAILFSDISVSFQIIDSNQFKRFSAEFPDASVTYSKCEL